jgi:hypothetical protein
MIKKETIFEKAVKIKADIELINKEVDLVKRSCGQKKRKKDKKTGQYLLFGYTYTYLRKYMFTYMQQLTKENREVVRVATNHI